MVQNVPQTFETDLLKRKKFAERFEELLITEHRFVDDGLVIALHAPFGSGKSHFLEMWRADLNRRRSQGESLPIPVVLNAWVSDFCGDPLVAISSALFEAIDGTAEIEPTKAEAFKETARDVVWTGAAMLNNFVAGWTKVDATKALELKDKKKEERQAKRPDVIKAFEERVAALRELKAKLCDCFGGDEVRAIILVDELDRCRPDYAIHYLEVIKHVFDVRGVAFVLAVDLDQLKASAVSLFGAIHFDEYFRKFVRRVESLPSITDYRRLCSSYFPRYIATVEGAGPKRDSVLTTDTFVSDHLPAILRGFAVTPRQAQEIFRIAGFVGAATKLSRGRVAQMGTLALFLLSTARIVRPELYHGLGRKRMNLEELLALVVDTLVVGSFRTNSDRYYWGILIILAYGILDESVPLPSDSLQTYVSKIGLVPEGASLEECVRVLSTHSLSNGVPTEGLFRPLYEQMATLDPESS